jgi:hypothetical protein
MMHFRRCNDHNRTILSSLARVLRWYAEWRVHCSCRLQRYLMPKYRTATNRAVRNTPRILLSTVVPSDLICRDHFCTASLGSGGGTKARDTLLATLPRKPFSSGMNDMNTTFLTNRVCLFAEAKSCSYHYATFMCFPLTSQHHTQDA